METCKSRIINIIFLIICTVLICFAALNNGSIRLNAVISAISFGAEEKTEINSMLSEENSLIVLTPSENENVTDKPVVIFEGFCLPDKHLTINGTEISINNDGSFKYDYKLEQGNNSIVLTNELVTLNYKIKYNYGIIQSYYPQTDMTLNSGMLLEIYAVTLNGANVYAQIGNTKVKMKAEENSEGMFITFKGDYLIPEFEREKTSAGKIIIVAELNGRTEKKEGAAITVLKNNESAYTVKSGKGEIIVPEIESDNTVKLLSPKEDHSNGMAAMCTVIKDYAEVVPASTANDRNDPRYSPELYGTVDYIVGECVFDEQEYYVLLSGVKIAKKNVDAFSGYIMPMNTVSSVDTQGTALTLTMNWKVPFVSELKEQNYYVGHASREFNVKEFTSSYIDFTFKYTNAVPSDIIFDDNSVVSYAQWLDVGKNGTSTLRVFLKNKGVYYGYKAYYSNDNRLIIRFKEKPAYENAFVMIDPGHGGKDCGAVGVNGVYESEINLKIANYIKNNLENRGVRVKFTRYDNSLYSLDQRQKFARDSDADLFIALHNNSSETSLLSGTEVYYYRANSQPLAKTIHSKLVDAWKGIYSDNSLMYEKIVPEDGGVRFFPFQVTRIEECPSVLVECGYLSNSTECSMLCNDDVQKELAKAIADGIIDYYNSQK